MYNWIIKIILTALIFTISSSLSESYGNKLNEDLIVLASPSKDNYYNKYKNHIIDFHIAYSKKILANGDDVIIFVDELYYKYYSSKIDKKHLVIYPMQDIWMRDFSLSNLEDPILFRYTSEGQGGGLKGQREANFVQSFFIKIIKKAKLFYSETTLLNDGGNFVDDYNGNVIISKKFLKDNKLSATSARKLLNHKYKLNNIAFIQSDEEVEGGLEHSDGIVCFIDKKNLLINSYPEDKQYEKQLINNIKKNIPGIIIHKIDTPYDDTIIYDEKFGSACGIYTNALVTTKNIYLPQFGTKYDSIVLEKIKKLTNKKVIPINSEKVCSMGGGVRCLSWQLRGNNAIKFRSYINKKYIHK